MKIFKQQKQKFFQKIFLVRPISKTKGNKITFGVFLFSECLLDENLGFGLPQRFLLLNVEFGTLRIFEALGRILRQAESSVNYLHHQSAL